jgi:hypothetical protein
MPVLETVKHQIPKIVRWGLFEGSGLSDLSWVAPKAMYIPLRVVYGFVARAVVGAGTGVAQWLVLRKQSYCVVNLHIFGF